MRKLVLALAGAAALVACDPTEKHDYSCTVSSFGDTGVAVQGCIQLHITEIEGNAAETQCDGTWEYHACATANRVSGYCNVPEAADYTLSGTPARVYFYDPPVTEDAAREACRSIDGADWVDL